MSILQIITAGAILISAVYCTNLNHSTRSRNDFESRGFTDINNNYAASIESQSNNNGLILNKNTLRTPSSDKGNILTLVDRLSDISSHKSDFSVTEPVWETIKYEAQSISDGDYKAASLMTTFVLSQPSLTEAIIDLVSVQLEAPLFPATQMRNLFCDVLEKNATIAKVWAIDLLTTVLKDDFHPNAISVLLFDQGFHSTVTYRLAHALWYSGRDGLSRYFQSLCSKRFGADIHPACHIGKKFVLAGGTGVVIGETAVLGEDCVVSHGVTLGGTGKESGDRHPKIGNHVNLGAGSTVLGNIKVGDYAIVNAGSVVTKPVERYTRVGGVPARYLGKLR